MYKNIQGIRGYQRYVTHVVKKTVNIMYKDYKNHHTYSSGCYRTSISDSFLACRSVSLFLTLVPTNGQNGRNKRTNEREISANHITPSSARALFFPPARIVEYGAHCTTEASVRRGEAEKGGGRGGGRGQRSYYGNTHARTRVSRFLWRAGSLDGALWRTVV